MRQFQHINDADHHFFIKWFPCLSIVKECFSVFGQTSFSQHILDIVHARAIKHRGRKVEVQFVGCPTQMGFEDLAKIHARGYTERIQNQINGRAIGQIGHIFFGHNNRNYPLVAVSSSHFIPYHQLSLASDIHLDQLHNTRRQFISARDFFKLSLEFFFCLLHQVVGQFNQSIHLLACRWTVTPIPIGCHCAQIKLF